MTLPRCTSLWAHVNEVQMTGLHCEMGTEWECHVTLLNGLPGVVRGEGWHHPQRPIEGLQTRYKTGTGPPSLLWDGRRRLLLGTNWINGLFHKNWRKEVYYHHVTLPSVCRWPLCPLLHILYCLLWFTTLSCSYSRSCCVFSLIKT